MKNGAQTMKPGDTSLGLTAHFIGAFGRAGGTKEMLQKAADNRDLMRRIVALFDADGSVENSNLFLVSEFFITDPSRYMFVEADFISLITTAYPEGLVYRGLSGVESSFKDENFTNHALFNAVGRDKGIHVAALAPDQIADLIALQPKGEKGPLNNSGKIQNVFFVINKDKEPLLASVVWNNERSHWRFSAEKFRRPDESLRCTSIGGKYSNIVLFYNTREF